MTVGEDTVLSNNTAPNGGAICITVGSSLWWEDKTTFLENAATSGGGGAIHVTKAAVPFGPRHRTSSTILLIKTGALLLADRSSISWNAESNFNANSAQGGGGALCMEGAVEQFGQKNRTSFQQSWR